MADPLKLAKFIKDTGLSYKQNSKSFIFTCPLCQGKEKLYIRKRDGKFACWRCRETQGFQGAPEYALSELTSQPVAVVKKALYGILGGSGSVFINVDFSDLADDDELPEIINDSVDLPDLQVPYHCLDIDHPGAIKGAKYLESRGIPLNIAKEYRIRYSPIKQSIMFPAYVEDRLVGWQYRTVENIRIMLDDFSVVTRVKSLSSKDLPRDRIFIFQNNLIGAEAIVLCEGPIDSIKAHQSGIKGVCAMGKVVTQTQANLLIRSGIKRLYVALDPDAYNELDPLLEKFKGSLEILKVDIPHVGSKPDLGALSLEKAAECILNAKPLKSNRINVWLKPI